MQRSCLSQLTTCRLTALTILLLAAGCSHHAQNATLPSSPAPQAAVAPIPPAVLPGAAPGTDFQPYTLLPAPPVVTHRHRVLHLTRFHNRVYLADSDRHLYEAGRDAQGHVYPVYRDPATHAAYPLYYDSRRDTLYRLAQNDDGRFYRNSVGQPANQFFPADRDYERIGPTDDDRPVVTDSYNTYNYNTYNYGAGHPGDHRYRPTETGYSPPPAHHSSGFNPNWLWAIPVVVGAYFLLHPHHHSSPPAPPQRTVIVRQTTPITIINQNQIINRNTGYPAPYQPIYRPAHRPGVPTAYQPVYVPPALPRPVTALSQPRITPIRQMPLPPIVLSPPPHPVRSATLHRSEKFVMRHPVVHQSGVLTALRPTPVVHVPAPLRVVAPPLPSTVQSKPIVRWLPIPPADRPRIVLARPHEAPKRVLEPRREPIRLETPQVRSAPAASAALIAPRPPTPRPVEVRRVEAAPRQKESPMLQPRPRTPDKPKEKHQDERKRGDKKEAKPKDEEKPVKR